MCCGRAMVAPRYPPTPGKESMETRKIAQVPLGQIDLGARYAIDVHAMKAHLPDVLARTIKASIEREGLHFPVLLDPSFKLIDGLRRIEAFHELGQTEIPAFVAETFADAIDYLIEVNKDNPVSFGRMGQQIMALRPLMLQASHESRTRGRWRATEPPRRWGRAREAYEAAFYHSSASVNRVTGIYLQANAGNPRAQELVKELEAGTTTPGSAWARLYQRPFFKGDVATRATQENLLRNTALNVGAVVAGFAQLKSPIKARPEVVQEVLEDLRKARATLISSIRELEKEIEKA